MSFTFKTDVLGAQMEVTGTFISGDHEINDAGGFEIDQVTHEGVNLEFCGLSDEVLNSICEDALADAAAEAVTAGHEPN